MRSISYGREREKEGKPVDLNKENMNKIRYLITFAIILYLGVQNIHVVLNVLGLAWGLLLPFAVGSAMAFVLNVPMSFIERHLFGKAKENHKKSAEKAARPVSLFLSIVLVILLILVVVLVVLPQIGSALVSVVKRVEERIPQIQQWLGNTFQKDSQIVKWADSINIQPEKILDSVMNTLKNGANNIVASTISFTKGIFSTAMNIGIGFVFACYVLLAKERLARQMKKAFYAMFPQRIV